MPVFFALLFFLSLFLYTFYRLTSETISPKSFRYMASAAVALFLLALSFVWLAQRPARSRFRIAVMPFVRQSESQGPDGSVPAHIAASRLRRLIDADTLIYPLQWLWSATDPDSSGNLDYLQRYARRIGIHWAVLGGFEAERLKWRVVDLPGDSVLLSRITTFVPPYGTLTGDSVAQGVLELIGGRRLIPCSPDGEVVHTQMMATKSLVQRRFRESVESAERAFALDSTKVETRNLLAEAHLELSIELEAGGRGGGLNRLAAFRLCESTILRHDSTNAEAFRILGRYYILREMWGKAEQNLKRAVEIDPDNYAIYRDISYLHRSRLAEFGFRNEEAALRRAIQLNPCDPTPYIILADYLYFNKWNTRAKNVIEDLLAVYPRSIEGLLFLGKMAIAGGDIYEVMRVYNAILDIDPDNADAYYNLGVYYYNQGDLDHAEQFFSRAVGLSNHADSHLYLGHICQSRGEEQRAIEHYRERLRRKKGPDDHYAEEARKRLFELTSEQRKAAGI